MHVGFLSPTMSHKLVMSRQWCISRPFLINWWSPSIIRRLHVQLLSLAQTVNPPFISSTTPQKSTAVWSLSRTNQTAKNDDYSFRVGLLLKSTVSTLLHQANTFCLFVLKRMEGKWKEKAIILGSFSCSGKWPKLEWTLTIWQFPPLIYLVCTLSLRAAQQAHTNITPLAN